MAHATFQSGLLSSAFVDTIARDSLAVWEGVRPFFASYSAVAVVFKTSWAGVRDRSLRQPSSATQVAVKFR